MSKLKDLTGKKFGRLTVLERVENCISSKEKNITKWKCKCDCDNEKIIIVSSSNLTSGNTKSCGCLRKEEFSKRKKKYNTYDLSGEYGIGYTSKGEEFYFDLEDYDKIKNYCWRIDDNGYVMTDIRENGVRCVVGIHRIITDCPNDLMPDHIGGRHSKNDNRKSNLRIVTKQQNTMNVPIRKNNVSGVTGVSFNRNWNKWVAQIVFNGENHQKGFDNFEDAVNQRKEWENQYFGEYSYDNSQNEVIKNV